MANAVAVARSTKCLARVPRRVKGKLAGERFCGDRATYNDLCRKHDRKLMAHSKFNQEIN